MGCFIYFKKFIFFGGSQEVVHWNYRCLQWEGIIISAVKQQKKSTEWAKNNGQFIPHPTTWLNQERWGDELTIKKTTAEVVEELEKKGRL